LSSPRDALIAALRAAAGPADLPLGLAVSGGGDSVALLCLAVDAGLPVAAVTVDHGLRPEAAAEAAWVAALCRDLGVPHDILRWQGWDGAGNLQDQARRARLSLIADWAKGRGIGFVALGHTQDDQAETVLMRLARSAGVDGLSAMAARRAHLGVVWLRPLLGVSRAALRDDLRSRGQGWIDDPSNDALRFDRVKARHVLAALGPLGVDAGVLAGVAARMAEAREALAEETLAAAQALARVQLGDVVIDRAGFLALPAEIRRRLLVGALVWVASAEYGPRAEPVQALLAAIARGRGGTLGGCRVLCGPKTLRITREAKAVAEIIASVGGVWDGRWRITGPQIKGLQVRALGAAGLAQCPDWRAAGLPHASALALPGVWRDAALVAAPVLRADESWQASPAGPSDAFFLSLLSH
jgi:tRNA(Ile)-lysidine synthase